MRAGPWLSIVFALSFALTGITVGEHVGNCAPRARSSPLLYKYDRLLPPVPGRVFVRTSIFRLMDSNQPAISSLRRGVQVMQSRQCTNPTDPTKCDPTSWIYQANIHGTYETAGTALWNQCQHGSFYFFSWHRMYLYYFERILRAASGDSNLTLPYWNYTDDPARADPDQRQLPQPFRQPADSSANPLYVPNRAGPINDGTGYLPRADVDYSNAFRFTNFDGPSGSGSASFGGGIVAQPNQFNGDFGQLESTPHNIVHVDIGGSSGFQCTGGWMTDPNCAARDPIFFLHHANIDRLWKRWLDRGGRQNPVNDQAWMNTMFTFYDEQGHQVQMSGKSILDTINQLGYCYDDDPACPGARPNSPSNLNVVVD